MRQAEDKECVKEWLSGMIPQDDVIMATIYLVSTTLKV